MRKFLIAVLAGIMLALPSTALAYDLEVEDGGGHVSWYEEWIDYRGADEGFYICKSSGDGYGNQWYSCVHIPIWY